ncbi:MAG: hypothetical protein A3J55_04405 [Candidatus Ryanbacteria bacterium RIFCSPHIGHO2_02_FULL_45_17b]|uniref:Nicotinamide phosphoribosyltransferase N-terminal domain-containing protein n=1 Tax=Candidatus Ryanbacteria bacterium RIFCSPHIGHO2_01_FULL_45_22 TaxID=1802114 RepID=A0A1G2G296_9BACT|nr:MAG: hypothetical protein A2719_04980 [Candidatus Ryanbacteria bacterium RIFCSPHIGHO2_01_FULL_45_22]OGZ47587.1 MAG: hypothetical protein A3J55_04405 [Candidatus Ryanbacteria bacterium RIFCSPHIGHO2_02_FULL_45_17b]
MLGSIIRRTDSYKVGHWKQYEPGTQFIYSYLEPRAGGEYREVMFFGLQYYLRKYLSGQVIAYLSDALADWRRARAGLMLNL